MTNTNSVGNAEKQVFKMATFEDGIWEIYLGLFNVLMGAYSLTRKALGPGFNALLMIGAILLLVGLGWLIKKNLIGPRIGLVQFGGRTKRVIKKANAVTILMVVGTLILMVLAAGGLVNDPAWSVLPGWLEDFDLDMVFALVIIAIFSWVAYTLGLPRFYLHGFLMGAGNFVSTVLKASRGVLFAWPTFLAGMIIAVIGLLVLAQFIRKYPLPADPRMDSPENLGGSS
jgi:hypothetical protein